jgi:hypothetical protein
LPRISKLLAYRSLFKLSRYSISPKRYYDGFFVHLCSAADLSPQNQFTYLDKFYQGIL